MTGSGEPLNDPDLDSLWAELLTSAPETNRYTQKKLKKAPEKPAAPVVDNGLRIVHTFPDGAFLVRDDWGHEYWRPAPKKPAAPPGPKYDQCSECRSMVPWGDLEAHLRWHQNLVS